MAHKPLGRMARWAAVVAALSAVSVGLASCGVGTQSAPQPLDPKAVPYGLLGPTSAPRTSVAGLPTARVTVYLESPSGRLVAVHRDVPWPATIAAILSQLAAGPTDRESGRGFVSPASSVGRFQVGPVHNGVVSVDLPVSFESLGGQDQQVAAAQIVYTVTTFTGIRGVTFLVGGQAAQVLSGDGSLTHGPSTRKDYPALEA
jgi:Sporulation and spore germination